MEELDEEVEEVLLYQGLIPTEIYCSSHMTLDKLL